MSRGRVWVGTSGFAYRDWAPRFYPPGVRAAEMLREYAARLPAVELNNTFYRQPRPDAIAGWLSQTPDEFRFVVKAQRGGSLRMFASDASPARAEAVTWLTAPYRLFGERLGSVLIRVPGNVARDDDRLAAFLVAWPRELPLTLEFQDASWTADEVHQLLRTHGAALCATDVDDAPEPDLRLTGSHVYLRLRRAGYTHDELYRWAERLAPFVEEGVDCYVFFRHDPTGESAVRAVLLGKLAARRP